MVAHFRNRVDAGRQLAQMLGPVVGAEPVVVLALPRGGVPVGAEVARELRAPLKTFVVRKLGAPGFEEFAIGAVASGGIVQLNQETVERLGLSSFQVRQVINRELNELERRERIYGSNYSHGEIHGQVIVLVDDGIATGSSLKVAVRTLRQLEPQKIIVAVPVAPASARPEFESCADEFVAVLEPTEFYAVGEWYTDFSQTTDLEVATILEDFERQGLAQQF